MLDANQAPDAHARPALPAPRHRPARIAGPSRRGRYPVRCRPDPAAGAGGRPAARCRDPPGCDDAGLRRVGRRGRLGLEGRLRGHRSRRRAVRAALRPGDAPACGRRCGRPPHHAGDARCRRRARTLAHEALGRAGPPAAVLDAAAARLCRAQGRRDPAGRHRAGALGRHRHAGGDGGVRARQGPPPAISTSTNTRRPAPAS